MGTRSRLSVATDIAVLLLCVTATLVVVTRFFSASSLPAPPGARQIIGLQLDASVGIDWSNGTRALVLLLHSDCGFCRESMPFYRRLLANRPDNTQIVVVASPQDVRMRDYLASERVAPDAVVSVEPSALPIRVTPALFVVDTTGTITHAWIGRLDDDREAAVIDVLTGRGS